MNGPARQTIAAGETLPLFANSGEESLSATPAVELPPTSERPARVPNSGNTDRHMQAAWQLSKALKAAKSGHKSGRKIARMTPNQRHQVGNAICEHLLASLRQQVQQERVQEEQS